MDITFCGIDPSLRGTAMTVIDSKNKLLESKLIKSTNEKFEREMDERIETIRIIGSRVYMFVKRYEPQYICIENFSFGSRNSLPIQGMVTGCILNSIRDTFSEDYQPFIIMPSPISVKMFAANSNSAKKDLILLNVYKRFGQSFDDDNLADSYVLTQMARCIYFIDNELMNLFRHGNKITIGKEVFELHIKNIMKKGGYKKAEIERVLKIDKMEKNIKKLKIRK